MLVQWVVLLPYSSRVFGLIMSSVTMCVKFCMFSRCLCGFPPGSLASFKNVFFKLHLLQIAHCLFRMYSHLMPRVPGIDSQSTGMLTRIKQLLKINEWAWRLFTNLCFIPISWVWHSSSKPLYVECFSKSQRVLSGFFFFSVRADFWTWAVKIDQTGQSCGNLLLDHCKRA